MRASYSRALLSPLTTPLTTRLTTPLTTPLAPPRTQGYGGHGNLGHGDRRDRCSPERVTGDEGGPFAAEAGFVAVACTRGQEGVKGASLPLHQPWAPDLIYNICGGHRSAASATVPQSGRRGGPTHNDAAAAAAAAVAAAAAALLLLRLLLLLLLLLLHCCRG